MNLPHVKVGEWIQVGENDINAYVFNIFSETEVVAGYYQNNHKAIKEDFIWDGNSWQFKYSGPNGSYLSGSDEAIVIQGPSRH